MKKTVKIYGPIKDPVKTLPEKKNTQKKPKKK